jgi:uncharacterized protein (TIGR03663 family)
LSHSKDKYALILFFLIILNLAAFLRFYDLDLRPLHHDEGYNAKWALKIKENAPNTMGPGGRHGPLPHFLDALSFALLGDDDFSLRFFASLCGVVLLAFLYPFKGWLGQTGMGGSALLLGLSPLMIYFSRFAINEIFLVLFTLVLALATFSWIFEGKKYYFLLVAAAWSLMVATKETWIINLLTLGGTVVITYYLHRQTLPPLNSKSRLTWPIFGVGVILSLFLVAAFYTTFFTKIQGLNALYHYHLFWFSQGLSGGGHIHSFATYSTQLFLWELPILVLAVISFVLWLKFKDLVGTYLAFWAFFTFLVYSLVKYKTPWLIINILAPLGLLAGRSLEYLKDTSLKTKISIPLMGFLLLGCFSYNLAKTWELNFQRYDDPKLWVVYAQEPRFIKILYPRIYEVARAQVNPQATKINLFLTDDERSPLDWYLRRFPGKIFYNNLAEISQATILIFSDNTESRVTPKINAQDYEKGKVRSVGSFLHIWVKKQAWEQFKKNSQAPKG